MGTDLAVDECKAVPGIGNLLAETGGKLGKEVAVFAGGGFGVEVQLGDFTGEQRVPLSIQRSDIAFGVLDLARDAEKFGSGVFASNGGVDLTMIIKETLQGFGVATAIGLIGAGHQQREVFLLAIVARKVGMDAFGNVTEEGLQAGRWIELLDFVGIAECSVMGFLRPLTGFIGSVAGGVGVVEIDFALGNACFDVVKLGVENTDLAEVAVFEGLELGAQLSQLRFAIGELGTNASKLLAFVEEGNSVRGLLEDDFGWHAASASVSSSLAD
jgi:hypothetical protein